MVLLDNPNSRQEVRVGVQFVQLLPLCNLVEDQLEFVVMKGILQDIVTFSERKLVGWWEQGIDSQSEQVLYKVGDESLKDTAAKLQTGVGIDLDQPHLEILVYHKIKPKQLEVTLVSERV